MKWFVPEPLSAPARAVLALLRGAGVELVAPESVVAEFGHAVRKLCRGDRLPAADADAIVSEFIALDIRLVSLRPLAEQAMGLALAHMATFYDALYIALAIREDLKVLTADEGMVNAFAPLQRTVRLADLATS